MKPSRSGTRSPADGPRAQTVLLLVALATVLAFAGSAIFGLRRSGAESQIQPSRADTIAQANVPAARGRIEVLNGAGTTGLARLATERLREAGFDVVQFGNARRSTDTSTVMDRIGSPAVAQDVARTLGIPTVKTVIDTTRYVDVTVVLGKDWNPAQSRMAPREAR